MLLGGFALPMEAPLLAALDAVEAAAFDDLARRAAAVAGFDGFARDIAVWGGPFRLALHGVLPLADGEHPVLGRRRVNLTFRRAL